MPLTITAEQLAITTVCAEAGGEPYEGQVAVGIVICNRVALPYASQGDIVSACLHRWAFSEYWAGMVDGHYQQIAFDQDQAEDLANAELARFNGSPTWHSCARAWADSGLWQAGQPMSFTPGPAFAGITRRTVLYYNPAVVTTPPAWAKPQWRDAVIYRHTFFHDGTAS